MYNPVIVEMLAPTIVHDRLAAAEHSRTVKHALERSSHRPDRPLAVGDAPGALLRGRLLLMSSASSWRIALANHLAWK
jgi:hypothetical protein